MSQSDINTPVESKVRSEIDINTLLTLIPEFDTLQTYQVYRFIRSCDTVFELASATQEIILLTYALNQITGPGSIEVNLKQFDNWDDLKLFLIPKYSQTYSIGSL